MRIPAGYGFLSINVTFYIIAVRQIEHFKRHYEKQESKAKLGDPIQKWGDLHRKIQDNNMFYPDEVRDAYASFHATFQRYNSEIIEGNVTNDRLEEMGEDVKSTLYRLMERVETLIEK